MKKSLFFLCILLIMPGLVRAQQIERIVANKIHIDSLAILSNRNFGLKIYYQGNTNIDSLKLSISSTKTSFPADLENVLRPEGFSVTLLGDNIFILKGKGIVKNFPEGYFERSNYKLNESSDLNQASLNEGIAKSENKIYKIGDPNAPKKTGRAILSGYVKDLGTGEPLIGVAVFIENPNTSATTDAYGFYRIPLPKGEQNLLLKGYGLEDAKLMLDVYGDGQLDIALKEKIYS
ncbi:MAG: carboxypeptidase-like regulatory domain-containing protein, partial [Bacteroidales bacterium]|nr:carboxypeptidase-like regulatory domain-containing protein [Bacteroidales bacterium]